MKINYLILAHANFAHLDALINALDTSGVHFFIHIDKKSTTDYQNKKENVHFVKDRINVKWGGFSTIKATLKILRMANSRIGEGYYCFISGADYPIRSNKFIKKQLSEGGEFINIRPAPLPHKPMSRFRYYHFAFNSKMLTVLSDRITEGLGRLFNIRRTIPFKLYVGSQWFALSHECVEYILKEVEENSTYIDFFKYVKLSDEAFFQTIIGNSRFNGRTRANITFTDWSKGPHPNQISEEHIKKFQKQQQFDGYYGSSIPLFARKFSDDSRDLLLKIDRTLRRD